MMCARRLSQFCVGLVALSMSVGCVTTAMGRGPTEQDLANNGSTEEQLELFRTYEVVYEGGTFRRPGADPATVAAEIHLSHVDSVSAAAFSDDAFNYISSSRRAAEVMEQPAVSFDGFAHSGMGETVLVGVGIGGGIVTGGVAWFVNTTVRDGVSGEEIGDLWLNAGTGMVLGGALGFIIAGAYTYIVPNVSTPFAVPLYRQAARAFNEDLEDRVLDAAPEGDAPPDGDNGDDVGDDGDDVGDDGDDVGDAAEDDGVDPSVLEAAPAPTAEKAPTPIAPRP